MLSLNLEGDQDFDDLYVEKLQKIISSIRALRSGTRADRREVLAKIYRIHRRATVGAKSRKWDAALTQLIEKANIAETRQDGGEFLALLRLVIPGQPASTYARYSRLLEFAKRKKLSTKKLRAKMGTSYVKAAQKEIKRRKRQQKMAA